MSHEEIIGILQIALDLAYWPACIAAAAGIYFAAEYLIHTLREP